MMKNLLAGVAVAAFCSGAAVIEAWLDRRGFDRWSAIFLAAFTSSLIALVGLLFFHFGRIAQ